MLILVEQWVVLQVLYNYASRHRTPEQDGISSRVRHVDSSSKKSVLMHFVKFSNKDRVSSV
jgi:hypothetical protein